MSVKAVANISDNKLIMMIICRDYGMEASGTQAPSKPTDSLSFTEIIIILVTKGHRTRSIEPLYL